MDEDVKSARAEPAPADTGTRARRALSTSRGRRFWLAHAVAPLLILLPVLWVFEHSSLDLWVADRLYALEGGQWAWRDSWVAYDLLHHWGKRAVILFGLAVLTACVLSFRFERLQPFRRELSYAITSMALIPALIAHSKKFSAVPCPWDLTRYGADMAYRHTFSYPFGLADSGHCFPSGHASGGYILLVLYLAAYRHFPGRRTWFLLPGLLVGTAFGLAQQLRGAHFVSHDLWTIAICWYGALIISFLFRIGAADVRAPIPPSRQTLDYAP